ncbi:arylsulfatase A-like enzyme [Algoriphagus ratkowskyi]|uniref:Sulfatase n=1 Tax=Algoriphagus ratkowskyi TaxID=57028 RepID=A0A2W7QUF3_9BACT|nr:sulfatase [Algoriphagus ratkowskyi]PZX52153.1 arylsulfatase A-like enzyme [Algoriphagus ratkowskyi]TXD76086.1 sulfatase [Algoriphagus ratkowskyi]
MSLKKISFLFLVVGMAVAGSAKADQMPTERPNIIFIMADDHAYQAISAYGEGLNETPNIDRIAKEGAIFTRATVTNSICAPSRAVLLTGKHSFMNGKVDNIQPFDWEQDNFPKLMQANGYATALIGKIHLDGQPKGFDYSIVLPGQGEYYNPDFLINGKTKRIEGYVTDITTDLALDWLENGRDKEKPFVMLYHQKAPHRNWKPAPEYLTLYDDKEFSPPANFFDEETNYQGRGTAAKEQAMEIDEIMRWGRDLMLEVNPNGDSTGLKGELRRFNPEQLKAWRDAYDPKNAAFLKAYGKLDENTLTLEKKREIAIWKYNRYIKNYLRTIKSVDDGVGEVLDYLEANGLAENTIVVYTSDQGFYLGEHGWFDKRFMYEESFRTPLLVKYPKEIKPGTTIKSLVQNLDFAPTFLDYAGIEVPKEMQGDSFRKLVSGESNEWRDAVYYTYYEYPAEHSVKRHNGVSTDRYKLIHFYYDVDEWELYDLEKDPREMNSVYDDPSYAEVKEMMHKKFEEVRTKYGDSDANDKRFLDEYMEVYNRRNGK